MGFSTPLALLGLLALVAPLAIHLLRQRDLPSIVLPTLALLERARAESKRRFRLRDQALLALRLLAFLALALAAAAPFLRRDVAFDDGQVASLVLVVDDSMSMSREGGLSAALERAQEAVSSLPSGSEVAVVLGGAPARTLVPRTDDLGSARAALSAVLPSARGTDLVGASREAARQLAGARHTRRLLVLSDFTATALDGDASWPEDGVATAFERFAGATENVAVVGATGTPDPTTPGEVSVHIEVVGAPGRHAVELSTRDERVEGVVEITQSGRGEVTLHVPEGDAAASIHVEGDDALPMDDHRGVLLRPPAALEVLVVDGDPHAGRADDEVAFLTRALDAVGTIRGGALRYRTIDTDSLDPSSVRGADVIILANTRAPGRGASVALRQHVEAGRGLLVTGGDHVEPARWRAALGNLLPGTLGPARVAQRTVSESSVLGLQNVVARRALDLEPRTGAEVWARFDDGAPAVVASGRVAVWASTLDDDWTDLPYQPGFVAFLVETLERLGAAAPAPEGVFEPGSVIPLASGLRMETPEGERFAVEGDFADTVTAGVYRVVDETDRTIAAFVVAPPPSESDLAPGDLPESRGQAETGTGGVSRRPIDPWVFGLFGLFVIGEGWLRSSGRSG